MNRSINKPQFEHSICNENVLRCIQRGYHMQKTIRTIKMIGKLYLVSFKGINLNNFLLNVPFVCRSTINNRCQFHSSRQ